jgi:hypothetical protein
MAAGKMMMTPLLTTPEVARLLHLSERTVYAQRQRLGGFYPAGIRALRFRKEDIYAIMEGPQDRQLEVPVPISGPAPQQNWIQNQGPGSKRTGSPPKGADQPADPSIIADSVRFGLRDPDGGVSAGG